MNRGGRRQPIRHIEGLFASFCHRLFSGQQSENVCCGIVDYSFSHHKGPEMCWAGSDLGRTWV